MCNVSTNFFFQISMLKEIDNFRIALEHHMMTEAHQTAAKAVL